MEEQLKLKPEGRRQKRPRKSGVEIEPEESLISGHGALIPNPVAGGAIVLEPHPKDGQIVPWCLRFSRTQPSVEMFRQVEEDLQTQLDDIKGRRQRLERAVAEQARALEDWR